TPTHTGGVNVEAQRRLESRLKHQRLSAQERKHPYNRSRGRDSSRQTPRFKDEPQTPVFDTKDSVFKSNWDDDEDGEPRKSSW
ncbi:uncharacterized protein LOC108623965, partial [Ceratina calcarata]|uniref:Uncharacterized protein LOC108623965 n=1 Tax=Ceratina calcarata TaxID=156304 RepID=A0AAJ7N5A2_9HYME